MPMQFKQTKPPKKVFKDITGQEIKVGQEVVVNVRDSLHIVKVTKLNPKKITCKSSSIEGHFYQEQIYIIK